MDNRLVLGRVHIVEWLNPGDDDTGRKLFQELLPIGAAFDPKVEVDFHRIDTAGELLGLLLVFTEQYPAEKRTPLLHLETNSTHDGLSARDQEVLWRDFAEVSVPPNHATGLNLVVNLAAGASTARQRCARIWGPRLSGDNRPESEGLRVRGAKALLGVLPDDP